MITPFMMDEKIPAPPPKEARYAPPEYSAVFASSRSASSTRATYAPSPSAFDTAMFTPDVLRRASAFSDSSSSYTTPASMSTSTSTSTSTPPLSPSSSRTSSSSSSYPHPHHPSYTYSKPHPNPDSYSPTPIPTKKPRSSGAKVVRAVSTGLLAIVVPPIAVGGVALAATGAVLYGSGKLVEGIGRGIAVGPEMVWKAYRSEGGRRARRAFGRGGGEGKEKKEKREKGMGMGMGEEKVEKVERTRTRTRTIGEGKVEKVVVNEYAYGRAGKLRKRAASVPSTRREVDLQAEMEIAASY
ncbi:hypothetical protein L227DRAFT_573364 [Lentinus tigrinus ALCF2SS1-6]|uniref:Uncharacterized protein n=1 Tax=Lentinus tigrinus ALCF2SS1-6 TaxID=1328759 RepID=A0A5C2SGB9_9APHY|nr:hypothetical protein L227DRAFT_573364 [Lentinus tigrinus ALCF2SS1-6]